ncbi:MAG: hypothetical protein ACJ79K_02025 [Gemmatimonadaceae bacterium]
MVAEVDARHVPGACRDYCLIRETDSQMRRIWHYPADWDRLDDAALVALFEAPYAAPVARERQQAAPRAAPQIVIEAGAGR